MENPQKNLFRDHWLECHLRLLNSSPEFHHIFCMGKHSSAKETLECLFAEDFSAAQQQQKQGEGIKAVEILPDIKNTFRQTRC